MISELPHISERVTLTTEVWWHLPLLTLGLGGLVVACGLVHSCIRSRRAKKAEKIMEELYQELWDAGSESDHGRKLFG